ncbi:DNA alkylation repair protein [Microbacterium candidum]|uniref:DNA alkylation repair protein n=1 Tax=Microbacterium candidum TaxID=3041922 RepID=A0ABT7MZ60_9MICO|nr:DNA alkylation repair protein [Microbacterium sp. ASV49]MDL9979738.1 DNA alkylation repair protein [Microbacterium sp. ASV49]
MGGLDVAADIRTALRAAAVPERAAGQQAYMKSHMPFLGVTVPDARRIARSRATAHGIRDAASALPVARVLWDDATHREERYAAMALLALRGVEGDPGIVPTLEHMVRTGRWWDFTDELAHRFPPLLESDPARTGALLRTWSTDADLWIRRVAIIAQLGRKDAVDRVLLEDVMAPNLDDADFFIRKAIGWALRELARVDPDWVRAYVASHELSPVSRREALKHL